MFHSNNLQGLKLLGIISLFSLASCTTLPTDDRSDELDSSDTANTIKKSDAGSQETVSADGLSSDQNGLLAFSGVDPMSDVQINSEIKQAYASIAKLSEQKKYQQALNLLQSIKKKYPQLSGPDYQVARIYINQNKYDKAVEAIDLSLNNNPRNYYSINLKGIILRELGRFAEAKAAYLQAIEIYPPYPNSHLNLGVLSDIYMRDLSLALIQYKQYQVLTQNKDKKVANWIIEIERRIKAGG